MDLSALKNAARGIGIPVRPDLSAFSQEQRDALQPLVESMEAVGRLAEGIRRLPDTEPSAAGPVVPLQTRVLGAEPESQARLLPEKATLFRVTVTMDAGSGHAGDENTNCTYTYTVTSLAGDELGTAKTPEKPRYEKCTYKQPGAASPGLAYWDSDNVLHLYEALEEIPDTTEC